MSSDIKQPHLERSFGLLEATALNMSNMVGVGPFITIPLIIESMGGPQCMLGWVLGAIAFPMRRPGLERTGGRDAGHRRHLSLPA